MTTLSPRVPPKQVIKQQIKISPRSNFNISPVASITLPLHNLNEYSIGSPRLNTLESERSQQSARKKTVPIAAIKSNLLSGPLSSTQLIRQESVFGLQSKDKTDMLKFFPKKSALRDSSGPLIEPVKSYSTLVTPRGEIEAKSVRDTDAKGHRSERDEGYAVKKERLLMALIKKEAEAHELRQMNQQSYKQGQDMRGEEKSLKVNRKVNQGYSIERGTQNRTSIQTVETEGDCNDEKKKRIFKQQGIPQLPLNDMSLDSRTYLGTTVTIGNWTSNSKLYNKANPRASPNDVIIQQLSARSQQRGESVVRTARIQTLKSIYDSQPDHRKSTKKFR